MKRIPLLCCSILALSGCQVLPDTSDTTKATLRFRVHYQTPGLSTPSVEMTTTSSTLANRCVYVNEPFGIAANVSDPEGVRSIIISSSLSNLAGARARNNPGDVLAIPSPAEPTQPEGNGTMPNPGVTPDGKVVRLVYSTAKAFSTVTLLSVFEFDGTTRVPMRATARNWGQATGVSEVYHFYVEKADPNDPARQPGMPCAVPPDGFG